MMQVLTNPREFFENKIKEDPDFKQPLMIIGAMAVISAISAYIIASKLIGNLPSDMASVAQIGAAIGAIFALIFRVHYVVCIQWHILWHLSGFEWTGNFQDGL
jgi:hypothetical protein